jgi:hypothetical protein
MAIKNHPELYELLGFFEVEPEFSDSDLPWFYNRLTYQTQRSENKIICSIKPSNGEINLTWERAGVLVASFSFNQICGLKLITENGVEKMILEFSSSSNLLDFELQLKPNIHVKWGNQANV